MKKLLQISILVLLAVFFGMITLSQAACVGPNFVDVQAAVTAASRGATVEVCAGTATWDTARLTITKSIKLIGAGSGVGGTTITLGYGSTTACTSTNNYCCESTGSDTVLCSTGCPMNMASGCGFNSIKYLPSSPSDDSTYTFTLTGFNFVQKAGTYRIGGLGIYNCGDTPINVKINDNKFTYTNNSDIYRTQLMLAFEGYVYGAVYNNTFDSRHPYFYFGGGNRMDPARTSNPTSACYLGRDAWNNRTYSSGTANQIYFEDNTLYFRDMSGTHFGGGGFGGTGHVQRYNTLYFYDDDRTYQNGWENHGAYKYDYGSPGQEVYGNYQIGTSTSSAYAQSIMFCRSGKCMGWGNLYHAAGNQLSPFAEIHHECMESLTENPTTHACPTGDSTKYPTVARCDANGSPQHPHGSYFFKNFYGPLGNILATKDSPHYGDGLPDPYGCGSAAADGTLPRKNTDYFMHEPSTCNKSPLNDCTSGIGCGTALPSSCTAGTGFWLVTDASDCTGLTVSKVGAGGNYSTKKQGGALWRCASGGDSWGSTAYYTPYTYPHPIREAGTDTTYPTTNLTSVCAGADCVPPLTCSGSADVVLTISASDNILVSGVKACLENGTTCVPATTYTNMGLSFTQGSGSSWTYTFNDLSCDGYTYNVKAIDSSNNESANRIVSFSTESNSDTTRPTLDSYVLDENGRSLTLTFSEAINDGGSYADTDWTFTVGGSASTIECAQTWGSATLVCTTGECVPSGSVVLLKYTQPGDGIEDNALLDILTTGDLTVTNNSTQTCGSATSLWYPDVPTYSTSTDTPSNLGLQFTSTEAGTITHVCYYKDASLTGTHSGSVWCASTDCGTTGTELSRETFTSDTGTGWKCQELTTPVSILADVPYVVSVHFPTSAYIRTSSYFVNGYTESNLSVPSIGARYRDATTVSYPNQGTSSTNFWVDFIIEYAGASGPWNVVGSSSGDGCGKITQPTGPIVDEETAEVTFHVRNGWAISIGGTCLAGSGTLVGNT